jgi:hypothetical protein
VRQLWNWNQVYNYDFTNGGNTSITGAYSASYSGDPGRAISGFNPANFYWDSATQSLTLALTNATSPTGRAYSGAGFDVQNPAGGGPLISNSYAMEWQISTNTTGANFHQDL